MTRFDADVAVIGVGAMGSATLWRLAERGVSCVGFEQFEPGHDRGSSHGESRVFRTAYLEGPDYVPLAQRAISLWNELPQVSGEALITPNGALTIGMPDSTGITGTLASIHAHNLDHQVWDRETIRASIPAHRVHAGEIGILEPNAGFLRPELSIVTAVRRAESLGAQVHRNTRVDRLEPANDSVNVIIGDATFRFRHAVVSAGAWLPLLMAQHELPLRVTRQILAWFPLERPAEFAPKRFPVLLRDINNDPTSADQAIADCTFYCLPTLDGRTIKAGIHREGRLADPDDLDRTVTPEDVAPIQTYVERFLDGVGVEPVKSTVCMYTNTPDHDFLIGSLAAAPRVTVLGGFSGHGFKFAPVVGEAAADLVTNGETALPVQWLSPERFVASGVH